MKIKLFYVLFLFVSSLAFNVSGAIPVAPIHSDTNTEIPLFSNQFGKNVNLTYPTNWGQQTNVSFTTDEGSREILQFTDFDYQPIQITGDLDVSACSYLNIDIYPLTDQAYFGVKVLHWGENSIEKEVIKTNLLIKGGQWNNIIIPMAEFTDQGFDKFSALSCISLSLSQAGNTVYFDNIYFYDDGIILPDPGPTDYKTPSGHAAGTYFSIFSNQSGYGTAEGAWISTPDATTSTSEYTISGSYKCQKIELNPNGSGEDPTGLFVLSGSDKKKDVSSYDRISFDIWSSEAISANTVYFALGSPASSAGWKILRKSLPTIGSGELNQWVTVDIGIDELIPYWEDFDADYILTALEEIRFMTGSSNNFSKTFYVDNIYFYKTSVTPPDPGPTDYKTPSGHDAGTYFSIFSNQSGYGTAEGAWISTPDATTSTSEYTISGSYKCQKIELNPNGSGEDPTSLFVLSGSDKKKDVSSYDRISFDIWSSEAISANTVYFALGSPASSAGWKILRKSLPTIGSGDLNQWITVDIGIDELIPYWEDFDADYILAALEEVRFMTGSSNNFSKTFYVDNIYFYKTSVTPPDPGPTDYKTPSGHAAGTYFPVYSNQSGYGTANGSWQATPTETAGTSEYTISGSYKCQKIELNPNGIGNDPTTMFVLTGLDEKKDVTSYNRISFDIWSSEEIPANSIYFALCSPNSLAGWKVLRNPVPAIGSGDLNQWITVNISFDELIPYWENFNKNYILKALEQIRFMTEVNNSFSKTFYVDNIYFYYEQVDVSTPVVPAYLPPVIKEANNVISVFSDSYTNTPALPTLSPNPDVIQVNNDNVWKFVNTNSISATFNPSGLNINGMTHVHLDVWTETAANFSIKLNNSALPYAATTTAGGWLRLDIPVSYFQQGITTISSLSITGDNSNYFIDNLYFYKDQSQFVVDISAFNNNLGQGINLGDIFDYDGSNWNPDYIRMISDLGFSHIRLPVRWEGYGRSMDSAPYNINPEFLDKIRGIVDLAIEKNLKIIVNMHHHTELIEDPEGQKDRFIAQWTQIADYFRYYPDNLIFEVLNEPNGDNSPEYNMYTDVWNRFLVYGLDAIRVTNPNRPVMIGVATGGGIYGLSELQLPSTDKNLIVTVHYYSPHEFTHQGAEWSNPVPPVGLEWLDNEIDRINIDNDILLISNFLSRDNRPIHIGEFGTIDKADMDSRVRWTTYMARYFEDKGYSWAYWDFDAKFGIYDPVNRVYRKPLVDALLNNPMPEKPTQIESVPLETLYDSNVNGTSGFSGYGYNNISQNSDLTVKITDGRVEVYDTQVFMQQALQKDVTYRVSFTASVLSNNNFSYQSYFFDKLSSSYTKFSQTQVFKPTTVPTNYSFTFTMREGSTNNAWLAFDIGGSGNTPVTITLKNIKIEKVENRIVAAPKPELENVLVENIYSSVYSNNKNITFGKPGLATNILDADNGSVVLFSNFDEQTINLNTYLNPDDKKILHLELYAGSAMDIAINLSGNVNKTLYYPLPSHAWTSLDIDLSEILTVGKYINSIKLSGGSGSGRKLHLDHLYFYGNQSVEENRNIWLGIISNSWNNPANWSLNSVPDNNTIVYLLGGSTNYPVLLKSENNYVCKEIFFLPGAQLGRSDLLTYEKVHIQMNFDLKSSYQQKSTDIDEHLKYAAQYSSKPISRNDRHMLSMPLRKVLVGDLSFGGYPATYLGKINTTESTVGNFLKANWNKHYNYMMDEFEAGEGFTFQMNDYKNEWPFMEYAVDGNAREFGIRQVNGILELPYYEDINMSDAHRIHQYDNLTNISTFNLLTSSGDFSGRVEKVNRGDKSYRFIFEKNASNSPNVKYKVEKISQENFVLVGNPYMSAIDFDKFYEDNKNLIKPLYQLWTGKAFTTYNVLTEQTAGEEDNDLNSFIAPLQSFLIQLRDDFPSEGADLIFNIENITPEYLSSDMLLKSTNAEDFSDMLTITAANGAGSVNSFIVRSEEGSNIFSEKEGNKLISDIGEFPDMYFLKPSTQESSDMLGIPYAIIGKEQTEIPLAIATNLNGSTKFTFTGMDQFDDDAIITFIDLEKGVSQNITGMKIYGYNFDYTPSLDINSLALANEDRFLIRFSSKTSEIDQPEDKGDIWVYNNGGLINIMTTDNNLIHEVRLYDMQGRLIYKNAAIEDIFYTVPDQGITYPLLIVEVVTAKGVKRFKINAI